MDGVEAGVSVALALGVAPSSRDWGGDCVGVGVAPELALEMAVVLGESVEVAVPRAGEGVLLAESAGVGEAVGAAEVVGDGEAPGVALAGALGVPVPVGV